MGNKKVLTIVGMGKGISLALAKRFAKEGYTIAMISRNENNLKKYQKTLADAQVESHYFVADAGGAISLKNAFDNVHETLGPTETLIYNAAVIRKQNILTESLESLVEDFKVNVGGALESAKAVIPGMEKQGKGSIIFTGGGLSRHPHKDYGSLAIGKAGLRNLTGSLARALEGKNIKVGTVVIYGYVSEKDEKYNPKAIAEQFWEFMMSGGKDLEVVY
ncbi:SDR family NAD(P)-dependent oxidoreductase [Flexithrix dorotheae]|uniref:SDR family NAD(P)-dependent oxidoreductase n=1 Tax=Flexithrix dorotheae TaxID=70993 RepID=UPI00037D44C1|nr:SDR family NAD(P)-dependent oxidoreductase [Flexithrix dorotheae]